MARVRRASGVREHDLVARAKVLRESVDPLLPRLTGDAPREKFDRLRADLEEVREARDDAKRLEKMSRWGDPLARAYAGLLRYSLDPTTPTVVTFPIAGGEGSFATLSRSTREAELAVQQSDDPRRLLLGYVDWARKGLYFFAARKVVWCTGRSSRPPGEVVTERIEELPYRTVPEPGTRNLVCPHLAAHEARPYLEVEWTGAERTFRICRRCAKDDRHLLGAISEGSAVPDPEAAFPVQVDLNVQCHGGPECVHARLPSLPRSLRRNYELGRLSDAALIDGYRAEIRPTIEGTRRTTLVAGGVCYGDRVAEFLDALHPTPLERRALEVALDPPPGYFEVDEASASRALERLWPQHAEEIVGAITEDEDEARRALQEARDAPGRIGEILKRAQRRGEERELLEALPHYSRLTAEASWVDRVARAYRTQREGGAERTLLQTLPREGKERGLAYAFLLALGRAGAHAWQFTPTEQEFGTSLAAPARGLLDASAAGYHDAMDRLLRAAGVADWGAREPPAR
ncbi:MAG TPA: hypothetical protein VMI55_03670 [Thermoplasmata archaeon]|nr:hypothetical protein [Thermoplasmata archaeon]